MNIAHSCQSFQSCFVFPEIVSNENRPEIVVYTTALWELEALNLKCLIYYPYTMYAYVNCTRQKCILKQNKQNADVKNTLLEPYLNS